MRNIVEFSTQKELEFAIKQLRIEISMKLHEMEIYLHEI